MGKNEHPGKQEEDTRIENEIMKMKMMLEKDARFYSAEGADIPPEIEKQFLQQIAAFSEEYEKKQKISVFEKLGSPNMFRNVSLIGEAEIHLAWERLKDHMTEHGIELHVCSPNVGSRELYRFTTEELFREETENINMPGLRTIFIYDEFHPDPLYDNEVLVREGLISDIFRKEDLLYESSYSREGFVFNEHPCGRTHFISTLRLFKNAFDEIRLLNCEVSSCRVRDRYSVVSGNYRAVAILEKIETIYEGDFNVKLRQDNAGDWRFTNISIKGFDPFQ
jgi:hypothetical protein